MIVNKDRGRMDSAIVSISLSIAVLLALQGKAAPAFFPEGGPGSKTQVGRLEIQGTVRRPGTRAPVVSARVSLRRANSLPVAANVSVETTDGEGRFRFPGLETGRYYLRAEFPSNSGSVLRPSKTVLLTEGIPPSDTDLWLEALVRISGSVQDREGRPISGARVIPMLLHWRAGAPELVPASFVPTQVTDTEGRYEMWLPPGEYYLEIISVPHATSPVYYPGVLYAEDAVPLIVREGIDQGGINIRLDRGPEEGAAFRVTFDCPVLPGSFAGIPEEWLSYRNDRFPIEAWVRPLGRGVISAVPFQIGLSLNRDDRCMTEPLPFGEHELWIRYSVDLWSTLRNREGWEQDRVVRVRAALDPIGHVRFSIDAGSGEEDLDIGPIAETPKAPIPGRVVLETSRTRDRGPAGVPGFTFGDVALEASGGPELRGVNPEDIGPDGTFTVDLYAGGLFRFGSFGLPPGVYVASVRSGGRDVLRDGLIVGGQVNPIEVLLRDDAARVEGVVRDNSGDLAGDALVVLLPPSNRRGALTTRFPFVVADSSGRFALERIPPGDYGLLALDLAGLPQPTPEDPAFLRKFERFAERITLDPEARLTVNPEVIPFP